jgi:phosphoglycolate phosphatase
MSPEVLSDVVIFDFDGTIVDSMPFLTDMATSLITSRYRMDAEKARRAYIETCGLPFSRQIEIIFPGDDRNVETARAFEKAKRRQLLKFRLFPGVPEAVKRLRGHGLKVCVSSGNKEELIRRLLESRNLDLDLVMGYRPGFMKGPDHFEFAEQHFGTTCERLVFVGDSQHDAQSAERAGIRFVAKAGLHTKADLEDLLPGIPVIESLQQLLPLVGIEIAREAKAVRASSRAD